MRLFCSLLGPQDTLVPGVLPRHSVAAVTTWREALTLLSCLDLPGLPWITAFSMLECHPHPTLTALLTEPRSSRGQVWTISSRFQSSPLASIPCSGNFISTACSGMNTNLRNRHQFRENIGLTHAILVEPLLRARSSAANCSKLSNIITPLENPLKWQRNK